MYNPLHLLLILAAIATPSIAEPPSDKWITMEGKAAGTNMNAMEQAKQDALRRAVEQACGVFITGQTQTRDYAAVYDKAMAQAQGYVTEFKITASRVENGMSYCTVSALVSLKSFEEEWARLLHTLESEENPRCIVVIVEDNNVDDANPPAAGGVAQSIIENSFMKKGIQLMDNTGSRDTRNRDIEVAAQSNDIKKLAAMYGSFKSDVIITGKAEARAAGASELAGRTIFKWSATISIRAYHTDSAQLLMSNSYTATATSVNPNAGGNDALKKCADEYSGAILREMAEAWRKRQQVRRTVQVTLENCTRADYKAFEEAVRALDGVQGIRMRELVKEVCQTEIEWSYDNERLISRIEELKVGSTRYTVTEQTHDRVTFKLEK
ncbi:MAG: hypothetical protein HZA51_02845 [Planctomycetes bacterium]|nr:hypothetical protein [Planctomycetota bacterium]